MIKWIAVVLLLVVAVPVFAQTDTPTPVPSPTPVVIIPAGEISGAAQGVGSQFDGLGNSITSSNGTSLIPNVNWALLFGYIKWLIAPPTGDELAGPFGPVMAALGFYFTAQLAFIAIKGIAFVAAFILSFIAWLIKLIIAILTFVVQVVQSLPRIVLGFFGL